MTTVRTAIGAELTQSLRERAAERFQQLGWPTTRLEEWKYTSLVPVTKVAWSDPSPGAPSAAEAAAAAHLSLAGKAAVELIFVNGRFASRSGPTSIRVRSLASDPNDPVIEKHLGAYADLEQHALVALNTAHMQDGAVIEVPDGAVINGFIHLLFVTNRDQIWSHPRNLIIAGRNTQLTVVETYTGSGQYLTNAVTEIVAGEGAVVDHYKIECESLDAFHLATIQFHQGRSSSVTSRNVTIGGALVRTDINTVLAEAGASLALDGLFVAGGTQHVDTHTLIDHVSPHCESHELYKGILDQNAQGIFDGRIIVRPNAQKTISRQENRNLLLSETAVVDSKPTLEIHNDDVKCNHGSTIGQLEEEPLFYLRSRGLSEEEARGLLVYAFAAEIVDRMKVEPVREQVRRLLFRQIPHHMPERRGGGR